MIFAAEVGAHGIATPLTVILIAAGAFVIPLVAKRVGLTAIVAEIMFGVLVGPVLGVIDVGDELITFLAELGLFLLMFLAGIEIDFDRLERQGQRQMTTGLAVFVLIVVAAWFGSGFVDTDSTDQRVFLVLLISAAALGLVLPTLRSGRLLNTPIGQTTLLIAIFAEVASVVGIVVFVILVDSGFTWELGAVPLLFLVIGTSLALLRRAAWWYPERFSRLFANDDPEEMGIRASLALMFVFVGLSALLGVEAILGAFLAGLIFSFVFRELGPLEHQLNGFSYGFFIPIFFINVGLTFPLDELGDSDVLAQALALVAVAIIIKVLPSLVLMLRGFSLRESLGAGFLLAGQLSVIIALADVGFDAGLLSSGLRAGAILLVGVSAVVGPLAFRALVPRPEEAPSG